MLPIGGTALWILVLLKTIFRTNTFMCRFDGGRIIVIFHHNVPPQFPTRMSGEGPAKASQLSDSFSQQPDVTSTYRSCRCRVYCCLFLPLSTKTAMSPPIWFLSLPLGFINLMYPRFLAGGLAARLVDLDNVNPRDQLQGSELAMKDTDG